jgi:NADH-quinone oxidoreductase subunit N
MDFSSIFTNDIKIILPEIFIASSILVLIIHGILLTASSVYNFPLINKSVSYLSILILIFTLLLLWNNSICFRAIFNNIFIFDDLAFFSKSFVIASTIACLLMSQDYINFYRLNSFEYCILILFAVLGLLLLISSSDLISAYLAIEMQSLSFYVLASFKRNSAFSTEAGLKYFILGAFSSSLILFGSSILYGFTGTTNFENLFYLLNDISLNALNDSLIYGYKFYYYYIAVIISSLFIAVGLLFKLAAAPFHMWSPDVYEGSPMSSTALFAIVPKIAILVLFARIFLNNFFNEIYWWQIIIIFSAILSVLIGSFVSLKQRKIKRLIAYSAISHVGYLLIAFATGSFIGIQALFFYIFIYMITGICIWLILLSTQIFNTSQNNGQNLADLSSLVNTNPLLAITFAITVFSLSGVPPLAGFYAKMQIFLASMESSMYIVSLIGIMSSVISTFYYIRIIKILYFEKNLNWNFYKSMNQNKSILLGITLFFIIFLFLNPNLLNLWSYKISIILL